MIRTQVRADGNVHLFIDIRYRKKGKRCRYRRDARIQTRTAAVAEERRLLRELAETGEIKVRAEPEASLVKVMAVTWTDAVKTFKANVLPTKKPSTRRGYEEMLDGAHFKSWAAVAVTRIADLVPAWDAGIAQSGVSASRRRNFHCVMRSVLRSALEELPKLPKLPKVGRTVVEVPSVEDVMRILYEPRDGCGDHRWRQRQASKLALALSVFGGLRASEVRGLRWSDVNMKAKTITVRRARIHGQEDTPKSGNQRSIPIAEPLMALLEAAPKAATPWAPVAPRHDGVVWSDSAVRQALTRACARLGIEGRRLHSLRHFFVTSLFTSGVPSHVVRALAGHASLSTTEIYAHHGPTALREAIGVTWGNGGAMAPTKAKAKSRKQGKSC